MASVADIIRATAERYGLDPEYMLRKAGVETGGTYDPQAQNPNSSAGGLFQFVDKTWKQYGNGRDKYDPEANADAAARLTVDNRNALRAGLGRDPTNGELYLAHQQGAGGALKLLRDPNAPAVAQVGPDAIRLNGGTPDITSGDFARKWTARFDSAGAQPPVAAAQPVANATPAAEPPTAAPSAETATPVDLTPVAAAFQQQAAAQKPKQMRSGIRLL